jgi:hypothetical protein
MGIRPQQQRKSVKQRSGEDRGGVPPERREPGGEGEFDRPSSPGRTASWATIWART